MSSFFENILHFFWNFSYWDIFILMSLESSIFPVPSELVMIPAGYLAQQWTLHWFWVILSGTMWSLFWATLNYFILWKWIWKPFLIKYGKYFLISEKKYHKAEVLFLKNDVWYTFLWRLLPVIRHLISIPAGIFKMNFFYFSLVTSMWAAVWCSFLTGVGYYFWNQFVELFQKYNHEMSLWIVILCLLWGLYFIMKKDA